MDAATIVELIGMINDMNNIDTVRLQTEEVKLHVTKRSGSSPVKEVKKVKEVNEVKVEQPNFTTANNHETTVDDNIASFGQVKYARDLMQKEFGTDNNRARDALAHTLEIALTEVPDIDTWETTLTKEMAGAILDTMESKRKRDR